MTITLRRVLSFALDCGVLGVYAGALFLLVSPFVRPLFVQSPYAAELTGFLMLTLPFGLYLAISEASSWSASFGKKIMGLRVVSDSDKKRVSFWRSLLRTSLKLLPWELAHFAIWHAFIFESDFENVALSALVLCYGLAAVYLFGLLRKPHRTLYDFVSGTVVGR